MKVFRIVLYLVGAFALFLVAAYGYYGGFQNIKPEIVNAGGETLVFEKIKGDYRQSPAVSDRVYNRLRKEFEVETKRGFGIYYDNPQEVPMPELRSDIGCILEIKDTSSIQDIQTAFYVERAARGKYVEVSFPFKGAASVLVGTMKVYPAIHNFMLKNGYNNDNPVMEIWDLENETITYRQRIEEQDIVGL